MTSLERHAGLSIALQAAVQLHLLELSHLAPETRDLFVRTWAADAVDDVASGADTMLYGGGKRGEVARTFNGFARGLAALAHAPGGVDFAGLHFCVDHQLCLNAAAESAARPSLLDDPGPEPSGPTVLGRPVEDVRVPGVS